MATLVNRSWKEKAIERSVAITDAWEVFKIYAGRGAEWILFITMVLNIVEMFPGVSFWPVVANAIMLVQVVTLDVAGFGLASMADHARACGHEAAAKQAHRVARSLIGIMIVTLLLVTAGVLFGSNKQLEWLKPWLGYGEDVLIFARIIMVVLYGHTIHKLREATAAYTPPAGHAEEIARLEQALDHASTTAADALKSHQEELARVEQSMADAQAKSISAEQEWQARIATLETQIQELQQAKTAPEIRQESGKNQAEEEAENGQDEGQEFGQTGRNNITILRPAKQAKQQAKNGQSTARTKASRAARAIRQHPKITPGDLAQKADIDVSYARKLLAEHRAKSEALNA